MRLHNLRLHNLIAKNKTNRTKKCFKYQDRKTSATLTELKQVLTAVGYFLLPPPPGGHIYFVELGGGVDEALI